MRIVLLVLLLSGCGTHGYVGVYHDFGGNPLMQGQNPAAVFVVEKELCEDLNLQYLHFSHYSSGWPFNDNPESTAELLGINYKVW